MWFALSLFTLVAYVDAIINRRYCPTPTGCRCQVTSSSLTVDCAQRLLAVDLKQLSNDIDSVLSSDHVANHLKSLSVTNTPLTNIPAPVCNLVNLTSLNLNNNKLTELPNSCFSKLTKLVTLSVSSNTISGLPDGVFDGLQSLLNLDLSRNHIAFIGLGVFSNSSYLTSLRSIDLSRNRLTSLEPWWYYRCILGNDVSRVNISLLGNLISHFTNELQFHFRCGMKRPYGYIDLSWNRITHMMDILNGWNVEGGYVSHTLICLGNLKGNYPQMQVYLRESTYACDCVDFDIYKSLKYFQTSHILTAIRCINKVTPTGVRMLATLIPLSELVCDLSDDCPSGCRCVYRPSNATLHVYCSSANLSSLPLDLPPLPKSYVTYKLDFSNNKLLQRLEHRHYFVNTSILDVSNCGLIDIALGLLKDTSRLRVVNLRGNILRTFPRHSDTVNISARLLIGNNPWRCSCENSWMIGWLQSLSDHISDPGDITCASPSRVYGRNVLKSTMEDLCVDPVKRVLTILLSAVFSLVFVVFLAIITCIVIYKLRVKFFRRWKFHPFDRDECVGEDMDYDVFLCCSSDDHNPRGLRILREMESNGYRVCYHLRDFLVGAPITDNMIQSVERSKRTVCLVSNNFLRRLCVMRYLLVTCFDTL